MNVLQQALLKKIFKDVSFLNHEDHLFKGVLKDGNPHDVKLTLRETPALPSQAKRSYNAKIGMLVREKVMLDRYLGSDPSAGNAGLIILAVGKKSPADKGGMKQGDLLTMINGRPVQTVKQFADMVDKALSQKSESDIFFAVQRGTDNLKLTIKKPQ